MLRFFRTLRRKFIEEDKARQYIWYALGEVFLVVIGILIALQINIWNENRKNTMELELLTESLIEELKQDTLLLNTTIDNFQQMYDYNNGLFQRVYNEKATIDTIKQIAFFEYDPGIRGAIEKYNTVTINILESTGKIGLFDKDTKNAIISYANLLSSTFIDQNSDLYLESMINYSTKYPFFVDPTTRDYFAIQKGMQIQDEKDFVSSYVSMMGYKRYTLSRYLEAYLEFKNSTIALIEFLEEGL